VIELVFTLLATREELDAPDSLAVRMYVFTQDPRLKMKTLAVVGIVSKRD
jgi:hypothetical protein